jgi:HAD superfamily hydrolase (TIGR01549 family)
LKTPYSHYSFDLDGTILDTLEIMRIAWELTVQKFHLWHDFSEYKREIGLPFEVVMENLGISDEDQLIQKFYFEQTERMSSQVKIFPNFLDFLERVKLLKVSTSIITSKPRQNSESLLSKFDFDIDILLCGDDKLIGTKPSPYPMEQIKNKLGLNQEQKIIYFGDMLNDLVFSVNSNIDYCHCNFGIFGQLPEYLLPKPMSIDSWLDDLLKEYL